jgi:energy-coupling factor transporter ATP-binding protein EcfA2
MLLDEGIQPSIVQLICTALRFFCRELGTTILFVEQNLDTILELSDRSYVMEKGRIVGNSPRSAFRRGSAQAPFAVVRYPTLCCSVMSLSASPSRFRSNCVFLLISPLLVASNSNVPARETSRPAEKCKNRP